MQTGCFGQSLSAAISITLYITLILNVYNLILGSLDFNHATKILFGDDFQIETYLFWIIISETILSIFAIMFGTKQYTSYIMFTIRFWTFGLTFATLFLDCFFISMASYYLIYSSAVSTYWEKIKAIDWNEPIPPPPIDLYILIAAVCYCVFKLYAAITILRVGSIFNKDRIGDNDIERNENTAGDQAHSSSPPPRYEQCILESEPPPPYSAVPKDY